MPTDESPAQASVIGSIDELDPAAALDVLDATRADLLEDRTPHQEDQHAGQEAAQPTCPACALHPRRTPGSRNRWLHFGQPGEPGCFMHVNAMKASSMASGSFAS